MKTLVKLALFTTIFNIHVAYLFAQTVTRPDSNVAKIPSDKTVSNAYANSKLTYTIVEVANHTYGYDVFVDGKLMKFAEVNSTRHSKDEAISFTDCFVPQIGTRKKSFHIR